MKVAIVYDYLRVYGGGERVLELFHEIYPNAPIFTSMYLPDTVPAFYGTWEIFTSYLQNIPFKSRLYPYLIPLLPVAFESFNFAGFDLVISISAGFAKGIITSADTLHVSYTLTVPRFLWGYESSMQSKVKQNLFLAALNTSLRNWDKVASDRVDIYLANSQTVAKRIHKAYGCKAHVIPSPVDEKKFQLYQGVRDPYFLIVSRLERYKRIDLAVKICTKYQLPLIIIGSGSEEYNLKKIAGPSVTFLHQQSEQKVVSYMQHAIAFLFPGADDLGLTPIEAQLCGTPIVAYGKDGVLETVKEGKSGVFFFKQTEEALYDAMKRGSEITYSPFEIRKWAMQFSKEAVKPILKSTIEDAYTFFSFGKKER